MLRNIWRKLFKSRHEKILATFSPVVSRINELRDAMTSLSDEDLRNKTEEFKERLSDGKETLDDILPEAFAVVREATRRIMNIEHYDVQLMGGIALHRGMISEMKTGEGKTFVATLPAYLNALSGDGVHVVTVNDYLVHRDANWMGQIYTFLGLTVGCLQNSMEDEDRKAAYNADITYGTNNEFGFDYLRDNLKIAKSETMQRKLSYAIIDEMDSILIDEARTPLIISGPSEIDTSLYDKIQKIIPKLSEKDYEVDEKNKSTALTEEGNHNVEKLLKSAKLINDDSTLYDLDNIYIVHHINQALKANKTFTVDVDYMVKNGEVMIIDEFTGRTMEGRRYSDGLHQAIEAKEQVEIKQENQTLASITFQNYFRMYDKLSGMTGTALTEAAEFLDIYNLEVVCIPTHTPVQRIDQDDVIYQTEEEKYDAMIELVQEMNEKGQPILIGTVSIERSEFLSRLLKKAKIPHNVLNARYHDQEASIISQAGRWKAVTIATNMAGRGTDIVLGGNVEVLLKEKIKKIENPSENDINKIKEEFDKTLAEEKRKVIAAGGLAIIGTERHESRRIDDQLRGRSGRQGDPGVSIFFLSLQDNLMRVFGSDKISGFMTAMGLKKGEAIVHPLITKSLLKAQQKVESRNYEIRKNLLKFDDVMNTQRQVIYEERNHLINTEEITDILKNMIADLNKKMIDEHMNDDNDHDSWDIESLEKAIKKLYGVAIEIEKIAGEESYDKSEVTKRIDEITQGLLSGKVSKSNPDDHAPTLNNDAQLDLKTKEGLELAEKQKHEMLIRMKKHIAIMTMDQLWKDHLLTLDHIKTGIGLRAYGQKDPLNEYKKEAFKNFENMMNEFVYLTVQRVIQFKIVQEVGIPESLVNRPNRMHAIHQSAPNMMGTAGKKIGGNKIKKMEIVENKYVTPDKRKKNDPSTWGKLNRNELCPCGSQRKYKHCHGKIE